MYSNESFVPADIDVFWFLFRIELLKKVPPKIVAFEQNRIFHK